MEKSSLLGVVGIRIQKPQNWNERKSIFCIIYSSVEIEAENKNRNQMLEYFSPRVHGSSYTLDGHVHRFSFFFLSSIGKSHIHVSGTEN